MTYTQMKVLEVTGKHIDTFEQAVEGLSIDMEIISVDGDIKN